MRNAVQKRLAALIVFVCAMAGLFGCTRNEPAAAQNSGDGGADVTRSADARTPGEGSATDPKAAAADAEGTADPVETAEETDTISAAAAPEQTASVDPEVAEEVAYLTDGLIDQNPELQVSLMEELAKFGPAASPAIPQLIQIFELRKGGLWQRRTAARVLGAIGPKARSAIPVLLKALGDPSVPTFVRKGAVEGLQGLVEPTDTELIPALIAQLGDSEIDIPNTCSVILARMGPRVTGALSEALSSPNARAREFAARAAERLGPEVFDMLPELIEALDDDEWLVAYRAVRVLRRLGKDAYPAFEGLLPLLHHPRWQVRKETVRTLGAVASDSKELQQKLAEIQNDDEHAAVRVVAEMTLRKMRGEPVPTLDELKAKHGTPPAPVLVGDRPGAEQEQTTDKGNTADAE